ncbi:MAG: 30S ribosomal protein S6 [Rhodospirillales bacterium]|jgi:small subunit ribosomal protein S6
MSYYESVFLARPDITAEQVEGLADSFTKSLEDQGGKVVSRENWGLRNLAYRIKKNRKAHYIMLNIDAPGPAIHEMERLMRLNEDVMRYMTIKVDELNDGPSVVMQNKSSRDERPRRDNRERDDSAEALMRAETDFKEADDATVDASGSDAEGDKGDES